MDTAFLGDEQAEGPEGDEVALEVEGFVNGRMSSANALG
jgi:hypothetical protein